MENTIHLLPDHVINQIAAGEVIENPASIVKELIENSLDARSTRIHIEILNGGQQLIRIMDDGIGMNPKDAVLSLERHATSKINQFNDLTDLRTMGFRGEALASIAAVSKFDLFTAKEGQIGVHIEAEGGKLVKETPFARAKGTTVEVRNLFYNVPARKKFQKSIRSNTGEIHRIVMVLALANPHIEFILSQKGEVLFSSEKTEEEFQSALLQRCSLVLGKEWVEDSYPLNIEKNGYRFRGRVGSVLHARTNRSGQYLFVNKRAVFSPMISYAARDAYGTRLDSDKHPTYVLHIELSPALVDVNVHPQKKEVRFQEEQWVKEAVKNSICSAWGEVITKEDFPEFPPVFFSQESPAFIFKEPKFFEETFLPNVPSFKAIGVFHHYLFLEALSLKHTLKKLAEREVTAKDCVVVDLIAAQQKILFSEITQKKASLQYLLLPLTVSIAAADVPLVEEHLSFFEQLGFLMRPIGKAAFLIEAIPGFLSSEDIPKVVKELVEHIKTMQSADFLSDKWKKELGNHLCQFPKAHKHQFMLQEALAILEKLLQDRPPFTSLQGKPILSCISLNEMGDYFFAKKNLIYE